MGVKPATSDKVLRFRAPTKEAQENHNRVIQEEVGRLISENSPIKNDDAANGLHRDTANGPNSDTADDLNNFPIPLEDSLEREERKGKLEGMIETLTSRRRHCNRSQPNRSRPIHRRAHQKLIQDKQQAMKDGDAYKEQQLNVATLKGADKDKKTSRWRN